MPPESDADVVVNTSPLLYLHRIGRLELLKAIFGRVIIPPAVRTELAAGIAVAMDVPNVDAIDWITVVPPSTKFLAPMLIDLGAGETEAIALASERNARLLVIDDQLGRRMAGMMNIPITGTAGVLLKAAGGGFVQDLEAELRSLQAKGMWLSDDIIQSLVDNHRRRKPDPPDKQ